MFYLRAIYIFDNSGIVGFKLVKCIIIHQLADVWSCGVTLYVMLVGAYPFEDPDEPKNFKKTIHVSFSSLNGLLA